MRLDELGPSKYKIFREHTASIDEDYKGTQKGYLVTDQSDEGEYTTDLPGDLACYAYWAENTRRLGAWAQVFPAKMTASGILPLAGQSLAADTEFAAKSVVLTPASDDHTKVLPVDLETPDTDDLGLVVQCANQDSHELLFFPLAAASKIKVDWLSPGNESTKVYGCDVAGEADLTNVGTTKDLWRVESNVLYLHTLGEFYQASTANHGPLSFQSSAFPGLVPPASTVYTVETKLAYDSGTGTWRWYTLLPDPGVILVDWASPGNTSSKIYGTDVTGAADPANVGTTKDLWRVEDSVAYFHTLGEFYQATTANHGPLSFQEEGYPTLSPPEETPYTVETFCAHDGSEWRWYTNIGGGGESTVYARIRWDHDGEIDYSEGEILTYDADTDDYTATGTLIWIDFASSRAIRFETGGNGTIFEVRRTRESVDRVGKVRDLYVVKQCREDAGHEITHFRVTNKSGGGTYGALGWIMSDYGDEALNAPWLNEDGAKILTTIGGIDQANRTLCRIPREWDLSQVEDFKFLEISSGGRGLPFLFRPIRPRLDSNTTPVYRSGIEVGGIPIAHYRRSS